MRQPTAEAGSHCLNLFARLVHAQRLVTAEDAYVAARKRVNNVRALVSDK